MDIAERIRSLKKERNALILAHNYCLPEVQDIADHVGDSLGLSVIASETDADVIVFCGVSFMAESAKLLNPSKTVLMPEPDAHCPMASMCTAEQLVEWKKNNPGIAIVGYVNSSASAKAEMDMCCTSSNAVKAVSSFSEDVLFVPDRNLGSYTASETSKRVELWDGYCPTHQSITPENISSLKEEHPNAVVLAHPECRPAVLEMADHIGSTESMIKMPGMSSDKEFIIATEIGLEHRLKKENPGKKFYFVSHAICPVMKMTTASSVLSVLERMDNKIELSDDVLKRAAKPLKRMIELK